MYLLGMRTTIPAYFINKKQVQDNHEKLVDLHKYKGLFFAQRLQHSPVLIRKGVAEKLHVATTCLPGNVHIKILSAYRSFEEQKRLYSARYNWVKRQYPGLQPADWERMTKAVYAKPNANGGGHQTGGAIDLTLCDDMGKDFALGSGYLEMGPFTPTNALGITPEAKENRHILTTVLQAQDFQNYPNEWWHFCYGDKMWATYKRRRCAIYGVIRPE